MAIINKESILKRKSEPKAAVSNLWGGELKYRQASSGDRIEARMKAKVIKDLCGDGEVTPEHVEAATFLICVEDPKFSEPEIVELMKQPGGAAEIQHFADLALKRASASDPTK